MYTTDHHHLHPVKIYGLVLTISIQGLPDSAVLSSWTAEAAGFEAGCHNLKAAGLGLGGRECSMVIHGHMWNIHMITYVYNCIYLWISTECRLFPWSARNLIEICGDIQQQIDIELSGS